MDLRVGTLHTHATTIATIGMFSSALSEEVQPSLLPQEEGIELDSQIVQQQIQKIEEILSCIKSTTTEVSSSIHIGTTQPSSREIIHINLDTIDITTLESIITRFSSIIYAFSGVYIQYELTNNGDIPLISAANCCPNLEVWDVKNGVSIAGFFELLERNSRLKILKTTLYIGDEHYDEVPLLTQNTNLEVLDLDATMLTPDQLANVLEYSPNLKELRLKVNDEHKNVLKNLSTMCESIEKLDVQGLSQEEIAVLLSKNSTFKSDRSSIKRCAQDLTSVRSVNQAIQRRNSFGGTVLEPQGSSFCSPAKKIIVQ